jgi:hypothetical protein
MSQFARVESVEALRAFKTALAKFADQVGSALIDAESDLRHTLTWVQTEQRTYWQGQLNKRHLAVMQARDALRQKKLYTTALSSKHSTAEEEKALALAQRAFEEAEQKAAATQTWGRRLEQEAILYRSLAQRMGNQVEIVLPDAMARLDRMVASLDAYLALQAPEAALAGGGSSGPLDQPPPESTATAGSEAPAAEAPADPAAATQPPAATHESPPLDRSDVNAPEVGL